MRPLPFFPVFLAVSALAAYPARAAVTAAAPDEKAGLEFFEKAIRPVLADKCYKCHSAEAQKVKGGLMLDTREGIRDGGDSGHAVSPGNPAESLLLKAVHWDDKDMRMPPENEGGKLPASVIADFEKWIAMGAPDPRDGAHKPVARKSDTWEKSKDWWAFQAPKSAPVPAVKDTAWPRTDVDRFILAAQEAKGLHPVADAEKRTLIRRVYFDLIGLPPSPEEVATFLQDTAPEALEKVVDKLLASPQFGERWGRHWLDVARFAESTGKERNFTFPTAWRYRDYVIDALNEDKPYDQFIREQVAGDLLPASDPAQRNEHLTATGFLALGPKGLNEKNPEQFRMDEIDEQIDTTTRAVLGLTVACARCHDHKFDPIPQKDYYAMAGIFRSTQTLFGTSGTLGGNAKNRHATPLLDLAVTHPSPAPAAAPAAAATPAAPSPAEVDQKLRAIAERRPRLLQRVRGMTPEQKAELLAKLESRTGEGATAPTRPSTPAPAPPRAEKLARRAGTTPPAATAGTAEKCMGVSEGRATNSRLLVRGEISQPGEEVPRGVVTLLQTSSSPIPSNTSGRLQLADWLVSPSNPLTARVAVNRIWLHLFGQGLVRTADNFGSTGETPSHPELLDALATDFVRHGWSVKSMIRSLVLSRTYQLSSAGDPAGQETDPDNRLLWRASPRRLDAEAIRDAMLAASGALKLEAPHGSVVANVGDRYIGKGIRPETFSNVSADYRSVYLPIVRDFAPEVLDLFDFAEPSLVVAARDVTNVPSQALFLMNNRFVRDQAATFAKRILATPLSYPQRVALAYDSALGRPPTDAERARADRYLLDEGRALLPVKGGRTNDAAELSWSTFCQALFASAEFRYLR